MELLNELLRWLVNWRLFSREKPSDLLHLLLDLQRRLFNHEILLVFDRLLVLRNPLPELIVFQPLFGLELAEIGDDSCEDLRVNSIGLPFIQEIGCFYGIELVVLDIVKPEEIFKHGSAEDGESNGEHFRGVARGIFIGSHLQSNHILRGEVSLLIVKGFVEVGALSGPTVHIGDFHIPLRVEEDVMGPHITQPISGLAFDFLVCRDESQEKVPELPLLELALLAIAIIDLFGE